MNIAILHYHLNRGGVTKVIINQLLALDRHLSGERWRVAILFSGRHDAWLEQLTHLKSLEVTLCQMPQLDYDASDDVLPEPASLGEQISHQLDELGFEPRETVIHTHNHSLGKNVSLPGALVWLAEHGYRVLFQIHDFAEDFRPANYRRLVVAAAAARETAKQAPLGESQTSADLPPDRNTAYVYPQGPHIHYAVLNQRDNSILKAAGVPEHRRHLLPNPVAEPAQWFPRPTSRRRLHQLFDVSPNDRYVLYPVRCIRRKNIGESILWSLLAPDQNVFGFTLAPENAAFVPVYQSWTQLADVLRLPCRFEVGRPNALRYVENLAAADLLITTSLVEGFGMVYLETWLSGHMLVGRDLPEITSDFVGSGIAFEALRPHVEIPLDYVGAKNYRRLIEDGYNDALNQYELVPSTNHEMLARRIEQRLDEGWVDFGDLDEELQRRIITQAAENKPVRTQLEDANAWIRQSLDEEQEADTAAIVRNAVAAIHNFGFEVGGQRIEKLYQQVAASEADDHVDPLREPARITDWFLDARRYRPIVT